jgi:hypothetical protein
MSNPPAQTQLEAFSRLIRDHRISHGAFRLWHALRDYTNAASKCFPGQRTLAEDTGCNIHSLKSWTDELVAADWLRTEEKTGGGDSLHRAGRARPTVAEKRNTYCCGKQQHPPLRKHATDCCGKAQRTVAEKRIRS